MEWPLVTIIITAYNYAHTIREALDSAIAQDYPNLEILVVDNASTDGTAQIVLPYLRDSRVRYMCNPTTVTAAANHQIGLESARGTYINYLSADDQLVYGYIKRAYLFLEDHPEIDLVYSGIYRVLLDGSIIDRRLDGGEPPCGFIEGRNTFAQLLALGCYIPHATILTHRATYEQRGSWTPEFTAKDYDMYLRWAASGLTVARLDGCGVLYRIHRDSISSVENYAHTGKELDEFCSFVLRHVNRETAERVRGYETAIYDAIQSRHWRIKEYDWLDHDLLNMKALQASNHIMDIRAYNQTQPFSPTITVIIMHQGSLTGLQRSILSLVNQTNQDWEALVVETGGVSLEGMCKRLDPKGRVKALQWSVVTSPGRALNNAISLTSANCICLLKSGNTFQPGHVESLTNVYRSQELLAVVTPCRAILHDTNGNVVAHNEIFPSPAALNDIYAVPAFPMDSLSFRRDAYDSVRRFHEYVPAHPHWDFLIRLAQAGNIGMAALCTDIYAGTNDVQEALFPEATAHVARTVYSWYPTDDPELGQKRSHYMQKLQELAQLGPATTGTIDALAKALRALHGFEIAQVALPV